MIRNILLTSLSLFFVQFLSAQCTTGDCIDGKGTYVYPSGAKYIGEFKDGEIHGVGVCYYTDGSKYSGQWEHRYPSGRGTKTFADGNKWAGQWIKGQPVDAKGNIVEVIVEKDEGDGTDVQIGCITGDCENGEGSFAYADGSKYEGTFRDGKIDGQGTWVYPSGEKYVGGFKENFMHGSGVLYQKAGKKLVGEWVEGEYVGDSRSEMGRVGCIKGDCDDGKGTYVYQDAAAKYVGSFKAGEAEGKGICYYANGDRYEGEWVNGNFEGKGTLHLADGTSVVGMWEDGTFMGSIEAEEMQDEVAAAETAEDDGTMTEEIAQAIAAEAAAAAEAAKEVKVWAVVIGISTYSHMPTLRYTDDDAYRMYAFLKSPEGGALKDDHIRILIDEEATRERILREIGDVFSQAGPNDLVMLYFSGHGLKGSFLPIDFDGYNNKILHEEINAILATSPAKYKLCIADACHSGSLFAMKGATETALNKYYKTLAQAMPGTALIMSSKSDETSLESSGLRQGVFSHFLIRGLKGEADKNSDTVISVAELYNYINENVRAYTGMRQSPVIKGDYDPIMTVGVVRQ